MEWKIGDLVDWDGTYPDQTRLCTPRFRGRITHISNFDESYQVQWPKEFGGTCYHYKSGSALRFTRSVQDDFETTGVE